MNKNLLWGVLAIVIAGGIWYFLQDEKSTDTLDQEDENMEEMMEDEMDEMMEDVHEDGDMHEENSAHEEDEDAMVQNEKVVISYTDSGYSPQEATVSSGTEVVFKNESSGTMWTASNPHPVHTDFSAFDAGEATSSGGTYSFIFQDAGIYGYHNHLKSSTGGTIIVE